MIRRVLRSQDLRLAALALLGWGLLKILDGSWASETIASPTVGYRVGWFLAMGIIFGYRGLLLSLLPDFLSSMFPAPDRATLYFLPVYFGSYGLAVYIFRRFGGREPWLCRERSVWVFMTSAAICSGLTALVGWGARFYVNGEEGPILVTMRWLSALAGMLVLTPVVLTFLANPLRRGVTGGDRTSLPVPAITRTEAAELAAEVAFFAGILWGGVHFLAAYNLNVTYLALAPLILFSVRNGLPAATIALAINAVTASSLWLVLGWGRVYSAGELRLLMLVGGFLVLILSALVEERKRGRTELERTVGELRESEEKFSTAFQSAPVFLAIASLENRRILEVNEALLRRTGYSREELMGKTGEELGWIEPSSEEEPFDSVEVRVRTKSGEVIRCEASSERIVLRGERCVISMLLDVEHRHRAEEAKDALERQLHHAEKMQILGRFSAGVAHDFNNLLTVINGYSDLLVKKAGGQPEVQRQAALIRAAGASAAELTDQLLAFSQKRVIQPEMLDLNDVVRTSVEMLSRLLGGEIALETRLAPGLYPILATRSGVERILMNLAANARDAMPSGGRLVVRTRNTLTGEEPGVTLEIEDNGPGIPPELTDKIFEPFFTTKAAGGGTGMGLAIVYGKVNQWGGSVAVDSKPGAGTRFTLYFPASVDPPPAGAPLAGDRDAEALEAPGCVTVLLAEDEPSVRAFACGVLRSSGYTVIEAADGSQALESSRRHDGQVDVLVSDIVMPGMRGTELARRLQLARPGIAVLLLSGYAPEPIPADLASTPFLPKPFSAEQLLTAVNQTLRKCVS